MKFKYDTVVFMVLYWNIRLIIEWLSRWWQCLEVFNNSYNKWPISRALVATDTSSTHLVWQNIKGDWSDWFMVIYVSLLAGESWNNLHKPLKKFSISQPVVLTLGWKAPWMTWSPQEPTSNNLGIYSQLRMFFNFLCTDQFVFGPSIESIDRLFVGRFVVAFKSSSKMLSAFCRLKNLESKHLVTVSPVMSSQNQTDISICSSCNLLFKYSSNESK